MADKLQVMQDSTGNYVNNMLKDILGDGSFYAPMVYVGGQDSRGYTWQQTVAGNAFAWSTGIIAVTSLLGNIKAYLNNPSDSGKTLYIYSMVADNGAATNVFGTVLYNPTTSLPTTSKGTGINMKLNSATASGMTLYAEPSATAMTGGTTLPSAFAPANVRTEFLGDEQMFILAPGNKLGINIPIVVAVSTNCQLVLYGVSL